LPWRTAAADGGINTIRTVRRNVVAAASHG
jgi:hypothetical protein